MDGILIIDKPKGVTSHDIVDFIRKRFQVKKVGHAGTLDPLATGLLIVLLGKFTKRSGEFINHDKEYQACLTLGIATDTFDEFGQVIKRDRWAGYNLQHVEQVFSQFRGRIRQIPPMFSALKYKGKRLYEFARQGVEVDRCEREVDIYKLKIIKFKLPHIYFVVSCSKGTYIRVLCVDIAKELGSVGYMSELRRIKSGPFTINQAIDFDNLHYFSAKRLQTMLLKDV
jgi:tRNA pseudouridine55 synthase